RRGDQLHGARDLLRRLDAADASTKDSFLPSGHGSAFLGHAGGVLPLACSNARRHRFHHSVASVFWLAASPTSPASVFVGSAWCSLVSTWNLSLSASTRSPRLSGCALERLSSSVVPWVLRAYSMSLASSRFTCDVGMSSR